MSFPENYTVETIASGCCGMAGSFGYEKEHYDLSLKIGELVLLPAVRRTALARVEPQILFGVVRIVLVLIVVDELRSRGNCLDRLDPDCWGKEAVERSFGHWNGDQIDTSLRFLEWAFKEFSDCPYAQQYQAVRSFWEIRRNLVICTEDA